MLQYGTVYDLLPLLYSPVHVVVSVVRSGGQGPVCGAQHLLRGGHGLLPGLPGGGPLPGGELPALPL